jgi:hypothetical protein
MGQFDTDGIIIIRIKLDNELYGLGAKVGEPTTFTDLFNK